MSHCHSHRLRFQIKKNKTKQNTNLNPGLSLKIKLFYIFGKYVCQLFPSSRVCLLIVALFTTVRFCDITGWHCWSRAVAIASNWRHCNGGLKVTGSHSSHWPPGCLTVRWRIGVVDLGSDSCSTHLYISPFLWSPCTQFCWPMTFDGLFISFNLLTNYLTNSQELHCCSIIEWLSNVLRHIYFHFVLLSDWTNNFPGGIRGNLSIKVCFLVSKCFSVFFFLKPASKTKFPSKNVVNCCKLKEEFVAWKRGLECIQD